MHQLGLTLFRHNSGQEHADLLLCFSLHWNCWSLMLKLDDCINRHTWVNNITNKLNFETFIVSLNVFHVKRAQSLNCYLLIGPETNSFHIDIKLDLQQLKRRTESVKKNSSSVNYGLACFFFKLMKNHFLLDQIVIVVNLFMNLVQFFIFCVLFSKIADVVFMSWHNILSAWLERK